MVPWKTQPKLQELKSRIMTAHTITKDRKKNPCNRNGQRRKTIQTSGQWQTESQKLPL